MKDLKERTGLNIEKIEVGGIDFLRDMAVIKIYYMADDDKNNSIDDHMKVSKEEWMQTE